jgi:Tat protein secretion system quality control protein TatD with DNase activity
VPVCVYNKPMFDSHSHYYSKEALVCGSDLELPSALSLGNGIGLLPPYVNSQTLAEIERLIVENPTFFIGEVGLDRRFESQCPLNEQIEQLRRILDLARELNRPAVLHCVRYDGHMISILKDYSDLSLMWHGFCGSVEIGRILMKQGVLVSFRPGFGTAGHILAREFPNRILVESDYTGNDGDAYLMTLKENYREVAFATGMNVGELEENCRGLGEIFTHKQIHR